eukprot:1773620-Amphidinium_carterae.1
MVCFLVLHCNLFFTKSPMDLQRLADIPLAGALTPFPRSSFCWRNRKEARYCPHCLPLPLEGGLHARAF